MLVMSGSIRAAGAVHRSESVSNVSHVTRRINNMPSYFPETPPAAILEHFSQKKDKCFHTCPTGATGFEPVSTVLETAALPLNYAPLSLDLFIIAQDEKFVNNLLEDFCEFLQQIIQFNGNSSESAVLQEKTCQKPVKKWCHKEVRSPCLYFFGTVLQ